MKVKALVPFYYNGKEIAKDQVIEMPAHAAKVYTKVEFVAEEKEVKPAKKK